MSLPTELHILISTCLPYPDALALKHTCRHFYHLVYTGVHLKVDWLVDRFEKKLDCPLEKCSFRTDEAFCNARIRKIMERRRRHLECRRTTGGCLVVERRTCQVDLVPTWLKRQGRIKVVKYWGYEGMHPVSACLCCVVYGPRWDQSADWLVLVIGLIFLCFNLLWNYGVRYGIDFCVGLY